MPTYVVYRRSAWGRRAVYEVQAGMGPQVIDGSLFLKDDTGVLLLALAPGQWDEVLLKGTEAIKVLEPGEEV
jgi:hypothetical protein